MRIQLIRYGKNIAGKYRLMVTLQGWIVGMLLALILGTIFMPKLNPSSKNKLAGVWHFNLKADRGILQIKENGYFYFDLIPEVGHPKQFKGILSNVISDTVSFVSFNNDSLLCLRLLEFDDGTLLFRNLNDSSVLKFEK